MTPPGAVPLTYVMQRLNRWVVYMHWLARSGGGGWPGPVRVRSWWGMIVLDPNVGGRGGRLARPEVPCPVDREESQQTTRCVRALPDELREVIVQRYLEGGTVQQQIEAIQCCLDTYYRRLHAAEIELLGFFNDIEAGVPLPAGVVVA